MKFIQVNKHGYGSRALFISLFLVSLMLALSPRVKGQAVGATLTGAINDQSGAVIPNATIEIKNVDTGIVQTVSTNGDGIYSGPNLIPNNYEVTASGKGFGSVRTTLTLTVGAQQTLNLVLKLGPQRRRSR